MYSDLQKFIIEALPLPKNVPEIAALDPVSVNCTLLLGSVFAQLLVLPSVCDMVLTTSIDVYWVSQDACSSMMDDLLLNDHLMRLHLEDLMRKERSVLVPLGKLRCGVCLPCVALFAPFFCALFTYALLSW